MNGAECGTCLDTWSRIHILHSQNASSIDIKVLRLSVRKPMVSLFRCVLEDGLH